MKVKGISFFTIIGYYGSVFTLDPLHSIEEIDIDQYGFTIRELLPRKLLFHTIFSITTLLTLSWILLFYVASIIVNEFYMEIWPVWLWNFITYGYFGVMFGIFLFIVYKYSIYHTMIVTHTGYIVNNNIYSDIDAIPMGLIDKSLWINRIAANMAESYLRPEINIRADERKDILGSVLLLVFSWIFVGVFFLLSTVLYLLAFWISRIFDTYLPLSRFRRTCEALGVLTPSLRETVLTIEYTITDTMNDAFIEHDFNTLAQTLSEIIKHLILLESIEKKVNAGNLFDSKRYISNMKQGIITSLLSLRDLLRDKKVELKTSGEALKQIQVTPGGMNRVSDHIGLASERGEEILQNLTKNIEKIDKMLDKLK